MAGWAAIMTDGAGNPIQTLAPSDETIASGSISATSAGQSFITLRGEGASADVLDSISAGAAGMMLYLRRGAEDITITHNASPTAGQIYCMGGADIVVGADDVVPVWNDGNNWIALGGFVGEGGIGSDVLAYDAGLANLATVAMQADRYYYTSADNTHVAGEINPNSRSLLAAADYAAMKALLDLEIGTDVQAYDADLTTWAGISPAAATQTLLGSFSQANLDAAIIDGTLVYDGDALTSLDTTVTGAQLNTLYTNLGAITAAEGTQLENIGTTTISAAQWIGLGGASTFGISLWDDADQATAQGTLGLVPGTDVQTQNAQLDDLAAAAIIADNEVLIGTAAGTYGKQTISPYMQGVLDDADEATFKATVNLEPGTDVMAFDTHLEDLAALGTATGADEVMVSTGVGTWALESGATLRTSLGVDPAGTDNSTDVTLAGTPDYLSLSGQEITLAQIDLTTDVTGDLPVAEGGTGSSNAGAALQALDVPYNDIVDTSTTPYTVTSADKGKLIRMDSSAGTKQVDLPTASGNADFTLWIYRTGGNDVNVVDNGTDLINGAGSVALSNNHDMIGVMCNGTTWTLVSEVNNSAAATQLSDLTDTNVTTPAGGNVLRWDGTDSWDDSTFTMANSYGASELLYSNGANTVEGLTTANNGTLITSGTGVPSISSTLPSAVQQNITELGTVTTGTWQGTTIDETQGGTGNATYSTGQMLYASASNTLSPLAPGTDGDIMQQAGGIPSWATPTGTGSPVLSANPTFTGTVNAAALTLSGDLTVNGTTTTVNSTVMTVDDGIIQLAATSSPANIDGGLNVQGATVAENHAFGFSHSQDAWVTEVGQTNAATAFTAGQPLMPLMQSGASDPTLAPNSFTVKYPLGYNTQPGALYQNTVTGQMFAYRI